METRFVEVTQDADGGQNWGKFMVGRFSLGEWTRPSAIDRRRLLAGRGWTPDHVLVVDLETGEGGIFRPGGSARADLDKHRVWVCPMFEPFLSWLYKQDLSDLEKLPVELPDALFEMQGYRRAGASS